MGPQPVVVFLATSQPARTVSRQGLHCVTISALPPDLRTSRCHHASTHPLLRPPKCDLHRLILNSLWIHASSHPPKKMCFRVWFVTDRRISEEYPQLQILRALKERCADEDVEFRYLLMDQIVLTISEGQLGKCHRWMAAGCLAKNRLGVGCNLGDLRAIAAFRRRWSLSPVFLLGRKSSVYTAVTA